MQNDFLWPQYQYTAFHVAQFSDTGTGGDAFWKGRSYVSMWGGGVGGVV